MKKLLLVTGLFLTASANADLVTWTEWNSYDPATQTFAGTLVNGADTVAVTLTTSSVPYNYTFNGSPYWSGSAYTNGMVDNAPLNEDQIMFNAGGTVTVSFSQTVETPLLALNSWNGNVVDFDTPIIFDSYGQGYWGTGSPIDVTSTGFTGSGELHGVVAVPGAIDGFSFTHTTELWHGLTIGVVGTSVNPPPTPVPAPATVGLLGLALAGLFRRQLK